MTVNDRQELVGMVERVARALYARAASSPSGQPTWEETDDEMREWITGHARAVIQAMREPTAAMIEAAEGSLGEWRKTLSRDEAMLRHYKPPPRKEHRFIASATPEEKHAIRWAAMIDAALLPESAR